MIAGVHGRVAALTPTAAVLDVGGVDVAVQCTPGTLARLRVGAQARLATSLVVREDSLTLFGFADDDEREVFELLQAAGGVGPRLAQAVLAVHAPNAVRVAVATEDLAALMLVPGIGRKSAQRIVLELRDKLVPLEGTPAAAGTAGGAAWREQLREALTGLGWSLREADEAVGAVAARADAAAADGGVDIADLLRSSLQVLSRA